jgi:hypothetical protein
MDTDTLTTLAEATESLEETPEQLITRGIIPEGYTRDPHTKEIRPKKRGGRPRTGTPPPATGTPVDREPDQAPDSKARGKTQPRIPRYQKGVIAAGMTKLYRRAGKIIKEMDRDIGTAVIECAEDCGEAWDELARTNPRVRRFLLKLITGGAWTAVFMAHAPILLAVIMKERIRKHIPFMKLIEAGLEEDETGQAADLSAMLGNMTSEDMRAMVNLGMRMMDQAATKVNSNPGTES